MPLALVTIVHGLIANDRRIAPRTTQDPVQILPDYQLVGVLEMADRPTEVIVLRLEDGQLFQAMEGSMLDSYKVERIITQHGLARAEVKRIGERYQISMKTRAPEPFSLTPLQQSFKDGYIDHEGRLTDLGRAAITAKLKRLARTGGYYMEYVDQNTFVINVSTMRKKSSELGHWDGAADPFAPPSPSNSTLNKLCESIAGETYDDLIISSTGGDLSVTTNFGETISIKYE
ncbi:MAG: hypothetical protein AAFX93_08635 [Verrucomicrobiota bacterium]